MQRVYALLGIGIIFLYMAQEAFTNLLKEHIPTSHKKFLESKIFSVKQSILDNNDKEVKEKEDDTLPIPLN